MIGRVGTAFGEHGVNIVSAAVGRQADGRRGRRPRPSWSSPPTRRSRSDVVDELVASDGFTDGRAVTLRCRTRDGRRAWWRDAVVYQVYPRSFQDSDGDGEGDLRRHRRRASHIAALGADALWLSPIYPSPMADGGYDVADYTGVDPRFGTLDDADALVAAAHEPRAARAARRRAVPHVDRAPVVPRAPRALRRGPTATGRRTTGARRSAGRPGRATRDSGALVPALVLSRAARPRLAQPDGRRRRSARRCASGSRAASTASASTRSTA